MKTLTERYETVSRYLASWSTKRFLLTLIIFQIVVHIPITPLPPMGQHVWRQIMGLSVARNYYDEGHSLLYSSQDIRVGKEDQGHIYTEFPLIYWLMGMSYHLTGFSHANGRITALVFGILLMLGAYRLTTMLGLAEMKARWVVFFLSCSPVFYYYSISILPNMPGLAMFIWGTIFLLKGLEKDSIGFNFWLGIILIAIGTATKVLYLFYGLPILFLFFNQYRKNRNPKLLIGGAMAGGLILTFNYALYRHGINLMNQSPFERGSTIQLDFDALPTDLDFILKISRWAFNEWFLQMYVNIAAIPMFSVGCYCAVKNKSWKSGKGGWFWSWWLISFIFLTLFFFKHFLAHDYYLMSSLPLAALGTASGMDIMLKKKRAKWIALFLVCFVPVVMVGRVYHRLVYAKQVPDELLYQVSKFQKVIPEDEQVLIVGDSTPVVYLYYLHRKGLSIGDILDEIKLTKYYNKNFRYVVSQLPPDKIKSLKKFSHEVVSTIGNFYIIRLSDCDC